VVLLGGVALTSPGAVPGDSAGGTLVLVLGPVAAVPVLLTVLLSAVLVAGCAAGAVVLLLLATGAESPSGGSGARRAMICRAAQHSTAWQHSVMHGSANWSVLVQAAVAAAQQTSC
jgi:hypothetical protein